MATTMMSSLNALHRFVLAIALPLLAAASPAGAAPVRRAPARVAAQPKPIVPNNTVIPLPLAPIVPAAQRLCSARTAGGLGYTMLRPGQGAKPGADATVLVNYIGYLASTGEVFDQGMRSPLPVNGVIPGFSQGLQMTAQTGLVRLCIPAAMGYGAQASGPIPANSDLVFQVEVLDFKTAAEMETLRSATATEPPAEKDAAQAPK